jgi:hypothetical protein
VGRRVAVLIDESGVSHLPWQAAVTTPMGATPAPSRYQIADATARRRTRLATPRASAFAEPVGD